MTSRQEKTDYFWEAFDMHIRAGLTGREALLLAADNYCFVFFAGDGDSELSRAAKLALVQLKDTEAYVDGCATCRSNT